MWRAIVFGCVLTLANAPAGEHSPGNDLNKDGGPQDRRVGRERHWQERRDYWLPVPPLPTQIRHPVRPRHAVPDDGFRTFIQL
jgi:hypothetical protein